MNCHRNYPWYRDWYDDFRRQGLEIIGIHTPETRTEHDEELVRQKAREAGFKFPVLIDQDKGNWNAWGNSMWPTVYLIDKEGYVRYWWRGELNWKELEGEKRMRERIEALLEEDSSE